MLPLQQRFTVLPALLWRRQNPSPIRSPRLITLNAQLAASLGLQLDESTQHDLLDILSANITAADTLAMKYGGHQFGQWNPGLGDGRGVLLGELSHRSGQRIELHLKGSGPTPFSRGGDGRAVLRSSLREYLASEALHALGVPTTRALALAGSSHPVQRERQETAATLIRTAQTHIRFGHFEWLFYQGEHHALQALADYVIEQSYGHLASSTERYSDLLREVVKRTAVMVAHWQAVGFTHGVMNTDNFSIAGETFDFGPFGFLERYEPSHIPNTSDVNGRYAWYMQPSIALWNLNALAHAFSGLVEQDDLRTALGRFEPVLVEYYDQLMASKLGLLNVQDVHPLLDEWLQLLKASRVDYHMAFRWLGDSALNAWDMSFWGAHKVEASLWLQRYSKLFAGEHDDAKRQQNMSSRNPVTVLRNAFAQEAISACERGDNSVFESLLDALCHPYESRAEWQRWATPHQNTSLCGPLSCSS